MSILALPLFSRYIYICKNQSTIHNIVAPYVLFGINILKLVSFGYLKGKVTVTAKSGTKIEIPDGAVIENKVT